LEGWGFQSIGRLIWVRCQQPTQCKKSILAWFTGLLFFKPDIWFPINICMSRAPPGCTSSSPTSIASRRVFPGRLYNGAWCARASKCSSLTGACWLRHLLHFVVGGSREFSWLFWWWAVFWCGRVVYTCRHQQLPMLILAGQYCFVVVLVF
jgi:hypothetical protein